MKKIIAILTLIFSLTFAGLFDTTYSIVKRDASLNQVNGGEEEFVIAQQIKNKEEFIKTGVNISLIGLNGFIFFWAFKRPKSKVKTK